MTPLEQSERILAQILATLAARGVRRAALRLEDLDAGGERYPPELFSDAIDWLRDEGFVRARLVRANPPVAEDAVLTARGFAVFGRTVTVGGQQMQLGEIIRRLAGNPTPPDRQESGPAIVGGLAGALAG